MPRSRVGKALTRAKPKTHGSFAEGAAITQTIMRALTSGSRWARMSAVKQEAAHMIVHKLHRIVTGSPDHQDHWDDIGGYAQLGADDCVPAVPKKVRRKAKPAVIARLEAVPPKEKKPAKKTAAKKVVAKKAARPKPAKKTIVRARSRRSGQDLRETFPPPSAAQTQEAAE